MSSTYGYGFLCKAAARASDNNNNSSYVFQELTMKKYFLILMVALVTTPAYADDPTIYGQTYGKWSERWAQWAYAGPAGDNPIEDMTGASCSSNQLDPEVWFLAGSFGVTGVVRNCTIPAGRALFYPLIEGGWVDCPGSTDSEVPEALVRQILAANMDGASLLTSTLDGVPISSLLPSQILTVRTQSPIFTVDLPPNNIWDKSKTGCTGNLPEGETGRQIIDGYWVMLPPLNTGPHVLKLRGAAANWKINYKNKKPLPNRGTSPKWAFDNEVTYILDVQ